MSNNIVRLAFDGSVASTSPPVRFQRIQLSIVPKTTSGWRGAPFASIHAILVPEKYGSSTSPLRDRTVSIAPAFVSRSQWSAVRRSCHTMARPWTSPVERFHATTVSRWFVMPMAAGVPWLATTSAKVTRTAFQISTASCSTHPGSGKCWVNSR